MFFHKLTKGDVKRFEAAFEAEGFIAVERDNPAVTQVSDMRCAITVDDVSVTFDWDATGGCLLVKGERDEVHLRSTLMMLGGLDAPLDARLEIASKCAVDERVVTTSHYNFRQLLTELAKAEEIHGTPCGNLGPLQIRTSQSRYVRSFGLRGDLATLNITAAVDTVVNYVPSGGHYSKSPEETTTVSFQVTCFDAEKPMTYRQCNDVLTQTRHWATKLQSHLPQS